MDVTLILGGARSGKSRYAERLALAASERPIYLATSRIWDEDHHARIRRHQQDRGPQWETIEEEKELSSVSAKGRVIVVDCVTLWLTNYFTEKEWDSIRNLRLRSVDERADSDGMQLVQTILFTKAGGVAMQTRTGKDNQSVDSVSPCALQPRPNPDVTHWEYGERT